MTECPRCYQPARHIPAGVTAGGREYRDFWSCISSCVDSGTSRGLTWTTNRQWLFLRSRAAEPRTVMAAGGAGAFADILRSIVDQREVQPA